MVVTLDQQYNVGENVTSSMYRASSVVLIVIFMEEQLVLCTCDVFVCVVTAID